MNSVVFKWFDAQLANIVNLAVQLFDDMRYHNAVSRIFSEEGNAGTHTKDIIIS